MAACGILSGSLTRDRTRAPNWEQNPSHWTTATNSFNKHDHLTGFGVGKYRKEKTNLALYPGVNCFCGGLTEVNRWLVSLIQYRQVSPIQYRQVC